MGGSDNSVYTAGYLVKRFNTYIKKITISIARDRFPNTISVGRIFRKTNNGLFSVVCKILATTLYGIHNWQAWPIAVRG
jgi:hypothetical protein